MALDHEPLESPGEEGYVVSCDGALATLSVSGRRVTVPAQMIRRLDLASGDRFLLVAGDTESFHLTLLRRRPASATARAHRREAGLCPICGKPPHYPSVLLAEPLTVARDRDGRQLELGDIVIQCWSGQALAISDVTPTIVHLGHRLAYPCELERALPATRDGDPI